MHRWAQKYTVNTYTEYTSCIPSSPLTWKHHCRYLYLLSLHWFNPWPPALSPDCGHATHVAAREIDRLLPTPVSSRSLPPRKTGSWGQHPGVLSWQVHGRAPFWVSWVLNVDVLELDLQVGVTRSTSTWSSRYWPNAPETSKTKHSKSSIATELLVNVKGPQINSIRTQHGDQRW